MERYEGIFDGDTTEISSDIMDVKEVAKLKSIISRLYLYDNNPEQLTQIYTEILSDDNVAYMITKISQDRIFIKHFPEFYVINEYGENVINCQQNSSYHKYGVFKHILNTIETVGNPQIPVSDKQRKILKWTMLLHDIGKPYVKIMFEDGRESFTGHDEKSEELSVDILNRLDFTESEKKQILTLIKYHDKYLNEGEITQDNMRFLASELENKKELFYLLIDVKDADAKAKSLEVYNKYKLTKNKYMEFLNTYFAHVDDDILIGQEQSNTQYVSTVETNKKEITTDELTCLIENVVQKKKIKSLYQAVIDIKEKKVHGYEIFTRIESDKKIDVVGLLNRSKDIGMFDKIQQIMFINGIEDFEKIQSKEAKILFVNTDLSSYEKYINKPRLYDMMDKNNIVIEFENYDKKDITQMQSVIDTIHKNKGLVALDKFGTGSLTIEDITMLNIDYVIPSMSLIRGIQSSLEKQNYMSDLVTFAMSKNAEVIALGVESKDELAIMIQLGVRYVQGYYFSRPEEGIKLLNNNLGSLINIESDNII